MKDLVSNCFLCGEHSLHVAGTEEAQVMQCINCGYVSSTKYIGTKETNEEYKNLTDEMKEWSKYENGRIWVPSIMTLPFGMVYPENVNGKMKWAWAEMVDIPKEEQENYPDGNGGFYTKRIDTDNRNILSNFLEGMIYLNQRTALYKNTTEAALEPEPSKLTLPKLKKK